MEPEIRTRSRNAATAVEDEPELVEITIDLPVSYGARVGYIEIGNQKFYDMKKYKVSPELARDLRWIMEQTIRHDHAVKGESSLNLNTVRSLTRRSH